MILHYSERQWSGSSPAAARRGGHRTDGYQLSRRVWICRLCMAWHDRKPAGCYAPCQAGKKDMLYFGSKGEGQRFMALYRRQQYGQIRDLRHHPRYDLVAPTPNGGGEVIGIYEADSTYLEPPAGAYSDQLDLRATAERWERVVEDYKPAREESRDVLFRWKKRHFEAQYGITIRIIS